MTEPQPVRANSNYMFLIVAVAIGAVATVVAFFFLSAQAKKDAETDKISIYMVGPNGLAAGMTIDKEKDLVLTSLVSTPETRRLALYGFTKESPPPIQQRTNRAIPPNGLLLKSDLGGTADFEFSRGSAMTQPYGPPANEPVFAMSIPVQGANALSGLLIPGDYVKIMITKPGSENGTAVTGVTNRAPSGYTSEPIVEKAFFRILAVGTRFTRSRQELLASGVFESQREVENIKYVTIEVTENQAAEILKKTGGNIWPVTIILPKTRQN